MTTKPKIHTNIPARAYYIALFIFMLVAGAAWTILTPSGEVSAAPHDINQCYDATTGSDVVFQLGHFVPSNDYSEAALAVDTIAKGGWQYTYFSGNAGEISSLGIDTGTTTASITSAVSPASHSQNVTFPVAGKYTVLAHGSGAEGKQPVSYSVLQEDLSAITPGNGKLRVIHAAGFDSDVNDLTLDVTTDDGTLLIDNLVYGGQGYAEVDTGAINLRAVDQTGNYVIFDLKEFIVGDGELITLILHGDGTINQKDLKGLGVFQLRDCLSQYSYSYNPLEQLPQFPPPGGSLHFVNLAPSSSNPSVAALDLSMNGTISPEFNDVKYGESTGYETLVPNSYTAQISAADSDLVLDSLEFDIEDKKDYTLVATGGGADGAPFQLTLLDDEMMVPALNQSHFRFGNFTSNGTPPPAINAIFEAGTATDLTNIAYEQTGTPPYQTVNSGSYDLRMTSGPLTLIDPQAVTFASRSIETFLAAGNGVEQPFGVFRITDGGKGSFVPLNTSRLYIAHLAPFADTVDGTEVTLEIDGNIVSGFSKYGDSTGYLTYVPGNHTIEIKSNDSVLASREVTLNANKDYTLTFAGSGSALSLSPIVEDDNSVRPSATNAYIRAGHLAPIDGDSGFVDVDFVDQDGILANDVAFGSIGPNYIGKAAGALDLDITLATKSLSVINPQPINLVPGDIVTLLSAGGDSSIGRGVYAIINGQKGVFLNLEEDVAHLYFANLLALDTDLANTAVTVRIDGETVLSDVKFGESTTGYVGITPGTSQVEIIPSNSLTPIIEQTITTEAQLPYQMIVHGNSTTPNMAFRAELESPGAGNIRVSVGNLVPASTPFYGSVNMLQNYTAVSENVNSGVISADTVDVATSLLAFQVNTSDDAITLLESLPISIAADSVVTVLAAGDGGVNQPFGLYAIIDNQEMVLLPTIESGDEVPKIIVSHFSPSVSSSSQSVALRINGIVVDTDFRFGEVTSQFNGNLGNNKVEIVDAQTQEVLKVTHSVFLASGERYFFFVTGGINNLDVRIIGYKDSETRDPGTATVTFLNVAPVPESITDRRMNLVLSSEPEVAFKDVRYLLSETLSVVPGDYDPILISPDSKREFANPTQVSLAANDRILYVATGDGDEEANALYQFKITEDSTSVSRIDNNVDVPGFFTHAIYLPIIVR